jgi:hypothetical protein
LDIVRVGQAVHDARQSGDDAHGSVLLHEQLPASRLTAVMATPSSGHCGSTRTAYGNSWLFGDRQRRSGTPLSRVKLLNRLQGRRNPTRLRLLLSPPPPPLLSISQVPLHATCVTGLPLPPDSSVRTLSRFHDDHFCLCLYLSAALNHASFCSFHCPRPGRKTLPRQQGFNVVASQQGPVRAFRSFNSRMSLRPLSCNPATFSCHATEG